MYVSINTRDTKCDINNNLSNKSIMNPIKYISILILNKEQILTDKCDRDTYITSTVTFSINIRLIIFT